MVSWLVDQRLLDREDAQEIQQLVEHDYLVEAGQEVQEALETSALQRCVGDVILSNEAKASEAHRLIVQIPFRAYLTTNYDEFIEGEYRAQKGTNLLKFYEKNIDGVLETYRSKKPFVLKLHGDINDPTSIVLGNRSYEKLLYTSNTYRSCLESIFSISSLLFVGFSGSDPDLEGIVTRVAGFDGRSRRHWMLVPDSGFPSLKAKRLSKDKGINVIAYQIDKEHSGLCKFLRNLASVRPPVSTLSSVQQQFKSFEQSRRIERIE